MRKSFKRMLVIAGVAALMLPTAVMAGWDQSESHIDEEDHQQVINVFTAGDGGIHDLGDFNYGMESPIGYDRFGDGTATLLTNRTNNAWGGAPWNTMPCPIQLATSGPPYHISDAMGNCPANLDPDSPQTDAGWGTENELYGVILDDLYSSLTETAKIDNGSTKAFKKVDQVLDILFYRSQTAGEPWAGVGTYTDPNAVEWYGGFGFDQTLDQDVADIDGTTVGPSSWANDHVAQTFYQDFRMWDKGNQTQGMVDQNGVVARSRHGIELLAVCKVEGADCPYELHEGNASSEVTLELADFAFFDQWVIQSLKDSYTEADITEFAFDPLATGQTGTVNMEQSYSSWMIQGSPGELCTSINSAGACAYDYNKAPHQVDKNITAPPSTHDTGDP